MSQRKESIRLNDGRNAERLMTEWETVAPITYQSFDGTTQEDYECGVQERVLELHVEKPREKYLQERVVERRRPVVYERETQVVDINTNEVVETKVESIEDSGTRLRTVEHLGVAPKSLKAQSLKDGNDCLTGSDFLAAVELLADKIGKNCPEPSDEDPLKAEYDEYDEDYDYDDDDDYDEDLLKLRAFSQTSSKSGMLKTSIICILAAEMAAIVYFSFFV